MLANALAREDSDSTPRAVARAPWMSPALDGGPGVGVGVEVLEYDRQAYALAERHAADTASVKRGGKPPSLGVSWLFAGGPDTDDVHHDESTIPADAPATLKEASSEGLYPGLR